LTSGGRPESPREEVDALMPAITEQDLSMFIDRVKTVGEESALRWARAKYGM